MHSCSLVLCSVSRGWVEMILCACILPAKDSSPKTGTLRCWILFRPGPCCFGEGKLEARETSPFFLFWILPGISPCLSLHLCIFLMGVPDRTRKLQWLIKPKLHAPRLPKVRVFPLLNGSLQYCHALAFLLSYTWSPWLSFFSSDVSSGTGAFVGRHSPTGKLGWNNQIPFFRPAK